MGSGPTYMGKRISKIDHQEMMKLAIMPLLA